MTILFFLSIEFLWHFELNCDIIFLLEKFAIRLKELRLENGLSQRQLAKAVGLSQSAITQYEKALREPSGSGIIKLAQYFNVTTDYLLGITE